MPSSLSIPIAPSVQRLNFEVGTQALLLRCPPTVSSTHALQWLEVPDPRFSIVVHGGAAAFTGEYYDKMRALVEMSLIRFAEDNQALLTDGATESGLPQILGEAYHAAGASFPLLGVSIQGAVTYPHEAPQEGRWPLNPYHSHFVMVDSEEFGAESHLLVGMAYACGVPSVAIVANGGPIVQQEIGMHARLGTPIITLKGTGRYADALAHAAPDSELRGIFYPGTEFHVFDVDTQGPEALYHLLRSVLLR